MARKVDGEICRDWCDTPGCSMIGACFEQEDGAYLCGELCKGYLCSDGSLNARWIHKGLVQEDLTSLYD